MTIDDLIGQMVRADRTPSCVEVQRFTAACRAVDDNPAERRRIQDLADQVDADEAVYDRGLAALDQGDPDGAMNLLQTADQVGFVEAAQLLAGLNLPPDTIRPLEVRRQAALILSDRALVHAAYAAQVSSGVSQPGRGPAIRRLVRRPARPGPAEVSGLLQTAMESKDPFTRGHGDRVGDLAARIACHLGMSSARVEGVRLAAMAHDIGKLSVPTAILRKAGGLTEEEYSAVKEHTRHGARLVRGIADFFEQPLTRKARKTLDEVLAGVLHHHEKYDGTGYPAGLAGEQIPEFAGIISVADVFDTLTSPRSYRRAWSVEQALAELQQETRSHFDPRMIGALIEVISRDGWHSHKPPQAGAASMETTWQRHDDLSPEKGLTP